MTTNASSSTTNQWLLKSVAALSTAGIATARLDCLVLLEDATGRDRSWLLAHPDHPLDTDELDAQLERRRQHEPLAYIRGKTEFYGREFLVSPHTLEPRPETEDMIDLLKALKPSGPVIDVGTGSGAIGITAALEIPGLSVTLTDIDPECLAVARQNAARHGVKARFIQGDLLESLSSTPYALLCNLPYVPDSHTINAAARQEPPHAIFGGPDGLDLYRRLFKQSQARYVLTESLTFQHEALASIASEAGYRLEATEGFIQQFVKTDP